MGTQPAWRVKFLQQNLLAWSYYSNAHRDRRIDPTFMPMTRRWSWATFKDLHKQNPNVVYNFPKFNFAPTATSLGLATQLREWNRQYQDVPDPAFVAASHFNRLVILLLDTMPRESPILEEQEMGLRHEITFNADIGPDLKQICRLYIRVRNLQACHLRTFEDMVDTHFWPPHPYFTGLSKKLFARHALIKTCLTTNILKPKPMY